MRLEVSLAPSGFLQVHLPSGRSLELGANSEGIAHLRRLLLEATEYERTGEARKGHIGAFPTQDVLNAWKAADDERKQREAKEKLEKETGISLDSLSFSF